MTPEQAPTTAAARRWQARQEFAGAHVRTPPSRRQRLAEIARGVQRRARRLRLARDKPTARAQRPAVRFHNASPAEVPDYLLEHVTQVYELQQQDSQRFAESRDDLFARLCPDRRATIAMNCNEQFVGLFENWAASCDDAAIETRDETLVFATDAEAKQRVESLGYVAYYDEDSALLASFETSHRFGDTAWAQYMYHQNWVIDQLLDQQHDLLFQDVDVVWRKSPIDFLHRRANRGADIQAMYDGPNPRFQPLCANSGFMYLRPSATMRSFWDHVYSEHRMVAYYRSQQEPLNVLLAAYAHRGLAVRILDEEKFANGHLYRADQVAPSNPWVMHNSWTETLDEKLERYRKLDLWFLD